MPEANQKAEAMPQPKRQQLAIDEASIDFLGRAARSTPMPQDSLTQSPIRDLTVAIKTLVAKLHNLNVNRLFSTQGPLSQLTGADIEARMRFELDIRQISADVRDLQAKSLQAKRLRRDLRQTAEQIVVEQERLHRIIRAGRNVLAADKDAETGADPFLTERFQRRLTNLITLQTANDVTCAQIALADTNMTSLIDRVDEVSLTLFALWQRNALAVAQSAMPAKKASPIAVAFLETHDQFLAKLF